MADGGKQKADGKWLDAHHLSQFVQAHRQLPSLR
jgi:hypothetical protein